MTGKKVRYWASLILVLAFVMGIVSPAGVTSAKAADGLTDISGHWAKDKITQWVGKGLVSGYTDGTFKPDKSITRAEFMTLVNKAFDFSEKAVIGFSDVAAKDWFYEEIAKAVKAGYISGYQDGTVKPNKEISRQEAAVALCKALNLKTRDDVVEFTDTVTIPIWSRPYIGVLVSEGYMSGYPDGSFKAERPITRAETVTMLDKALQAPQFSYNEAGTYGPKEGTETVSQDVAINVPGVTLRNMVIEGNLYLNEGIGEGDVTLDNVTVRGTTTVRGGGKDSIHLVNFTGEEIIVIKVGGQVRIVASGDTKVKELRLESGAHIEGNGIVSVTVLKPGEDVILDGDFENVSIEAKAKVEVLKGTTINNLKVSSKADINLANGATVKDLTIDAAANITGKGTIEMARINAEGAKLETEPKKRELAKGITVVIAGKEVKGEAKEPSGGGGGGGRKPSKKVRVTGISVEPKEMKLKVGETRTITAKIEPDNATNKNVKWTTDNEAAAKVDANGKVTAVSVGTAAITAETEDGGKTATCTVTVEKEVKPEPSDYKLTILSNPVDGGTMTVMDAVYTVLDTVYFKEGETVIVEAKPNEGFEFINWTRENGTEDKIINNPYTFKMPAQNVSLTANFQKTMVPVSAISVEGVPVVGQELTAKVTPDKATVTYQWQIADAEDGEYIDIDGATSITYIPVVANAGKYIRVTITGTGNYRGTVISAPVGPAAAAILSKADPNPDVAGTVDWTRFAGKVEVADSVGVGEISAYYIFEIISGSLADGTVLQYYHYETKSWQNFAYEDGKFRFGPKGGFDLAAVAHGLQTEFQGKIDGTGITGSAYLVDAVTEKIISNVVETTVSPPVINTTKNKGYNTIQAAIDDATAGDTIEVSAGTFDEALSIGKSLTILGVNADNDARTPAFLDAGSIVTGGIRITAGDITIKGLTIETKGILASNIAGLTLVNNKIKNISEAMEGSPAGSIIGIDVMTLATGPIVINQNRFSGIGATDGTGTAVRMVQAKDSITITDNIIEDVTKNGINLYANCLANENAKLTITGNEIMNWDSDKDQVNPGGGEIGGRAIRIDFAGAHTEATANIKENKLIPPIYPEGQTPIDSEYVKLTTVDIVVDLTKNYWGSASPAFGTILLVEGTKAAECAYVPYYTDEVMTTLAESIEPEVIFTFTSLDAVTAGTVDFSITTKVTNNGAIANDTPLRYKAVVTKDGEPLSGQDIKYPEVGDDREDPSSWKGIFITDAEGTANFGPSTGFTLTQLPELLSAGGVTTPFQAEFAAGEYSVTVSLLDISDEGEVELGSGTKGFSVGYVTTLSVEEPSTMVAGTVGWTRFAGTVDVAEGVEDIKAYYIFEIEGENGLAEETLPQYYHYSGDEGTEGTWLPFAKVDGEDNQYRFGPSGGFPLTTDLPARGQTEFQVNIAGDSITVKAYLVDADTEETISNVLETTITANPITE